MEIKYKDKNHKNSYIKAYEQTNMPLLNKNMFKN